MAVRKVINWAAQPIRVETERGIYEHPVSNRVLKLDTLEETVDFIDDETPIVRKVFYMPEERLPPVVEGIYYIVPNQVMSVIRRPDFISPDTKISHGAKRVADAPWMVSSVRRFRVCDELRVHPINNII